MGKRKKMQKGRRARGTGSIFTDARRGGFVAKVPVGRYANGRTRYKEVRARTQGEVVERMKAVLPPGPDVTVGAWCDRWLAGCTVRPSTRESYAATVARYVKPALGHRRVCDVTPADVDAMAASWQAAGRARPLGPNTVRKNLREFAAMMEAARRAKLCAENPARAAKRTKGKKVPIRPFPAPDLARICAAAATRPAWAVFGLLAAVGCRIGEGLALDVGDWNPAAGTIRISRTFSARHGLRAPKTDNGFRTIRAPAQAAPALRLAAGARASGPLFLDRNGARLNPNAARESWARLLKALALPYRNPHQLRHSVATVLVGCNAPLADVAAYLGDALSTVVKTYVHPHGADPSRPLEAALGAALRLP